MSRLDEIEKTIDDYFIYDPKNGDPGPMVVGITKDEVLKLISQIRVLKNNLGNMKRFNMELLDEQSKMVAVVDLSRRLIHLDPALDETYGHYLDVIDSLQKALTVYDD